MGIKGCPDIHGREFDIRLVGGAVEVKVGQAIFEVDKYSVHARDQGGEDEAEEDGR